MGICKDVTRRSSSRKISSWYLLNMGSLVKLISNKEDLCPHEISGIVGIFQSRKTTDFALWTCSTTRSNCSDGCTWLTKPTCMAIAVFLCSKKVNRSGTGCWAGCKLLFFPPGQHRVCTYAEPREACNSARKTPFSCNLPILTSTRKQTHSVKNWGHPLV